MVVLNYGNPRKYRLFANIALANAGLADSHDPARRMV
jgi:hypothetical protein